MQSGKAADRQVGRWAGGQVGRWAGGQASRQEVRNATILQGLGLI
jgi:hypothetical protein